MDVGIAVRLAAGWATVVLFQLYGYGWLGDLGDVAWAGFLFAWLIGIIVWMAFGVVHEAEELAHMLGEPYGTLILTLSIVVIEVALIASAMLGPAEAQTLARDTMFAVLMIVLNGVVGLGLLVGGKRHGEQAYNLQGATAYLSVITPLTVIALVLPNFTVSTADASMSAVQAAFFSVFTIALYAIFLVLQTGRHRGYFLAPAMSDPGDEAHGSQSEEADGSLPIAPRALARHLALLLLSILPIVILAKSLAAVLDFGIAGLGAPPALGGILIAMVVFTPEGISALKAISRNQLQRAVNLCLGAATSTLGLTVPVVLAISLFTGTPLVLGLSNANMVLLATTLILSALTFSGPRTTMLEGAVHLTIFGVFLVLVFSP